MEEVKAFFLVIAILGVFWVYDRGGFIEFSRRIRFKYTKAFPLAFMFININLRYSKTVEYFTETGNKTIPPLYILDEYLHGYLKGVFQEAYEGPGLITGEISRWVVKVMVNSIFPFSSTKIDWKKSKFLYVDKKENQLDSELYHKGWIDGNEDFEKARRYGETSLSLANHIINLSESKGEIDKYQAARYKAEIENSKQALTIVFREFQGVGDSNYHMYRFKDYKWGY